MLMDYELTFSLNQVVTAAAASTNHVNLGAPRDIGMTDGLALVVTVTEAVASAGASTLQIQIQTDENAAFSSPKVVYQTAVIPKASLVAGYQLILPIPVGTDEQFVRLYYDVATGPLTAGKITAAIATGIQRSKQYPDAI